MDSESARGITNMEAIAHAPTCDPDDCFGTLVGYEEVGRDERSVTEVFTTKRCGCECHCEPAE